MKQPGPDPLDAMLDQSLQSASHHLDGEQFQIQLAAHIAIYQRRKKLGRLLPAGMGFLATLIVCLFARPEFDFQGAASSLAPLWENSLHALAWPMQALPTAHNPMLLWAELAATALLFSLWFAHRDSGTFRL